MITKKSTKSGEPRYEVRHRGPDGKERSRTFRTKKEAERYVRNQQTAVDAGTWIDPTAGKTTLGQWASEWQRTVVHLRPKTRKIYADNLRSPHPAGARRSRARQADPVDAASVAFRSRIEARCSREGPLARVGVAGVPDAQPATRGCSRR